MLSLHGYTGMEEAAGTKVPGGYVRCVCYIGTRQSAVSVLMQGEQHYKGSNSIRRNKRRQHHKGKQHYKEDNNIKGDNNNIKGNNTIKENNTEI